MKATPEEIVRQALLVKMLDLGYPSSLIAVEKQLKDFVGADQSQAPNRRVDIVCFSKGSMRPLLMVECKAIELVSSVIYQVIGYNRFVGASFIAVANSSSILTGWYDSQEEQYRFIETLPSYERLLNALG